jgi:hypothetical protein
MHENTPLMPFDIMFCCHVEKWRKILHVQEGERHFVDRLIFATLPTITAHPDLLV